MSATQSPVPTGTVDLLTRIRAWSIVRPIELGHRPHVLQIGFAVDARRRADGDEDEFGLAQRLGIVSGEMQPAGGHVAMDDFLQPRLVDRQLAALEAGDPVGVDVEGHNPVAQVGEARPGDQADIADPDDGDLLQACASDAGARAGGSLPCWTGRLPVRRRSPGRDDTHHLPLRGPPPRLMGKPITSIRRVEYPDQAGGWHANHPTGRLRRARCALPGQAERRRARPDEPDRPRAADPPSFLAKIVSQLSVAGMVQTSRGARGGVALAREPKDISLLEVVEAIDGPITLNECVPDSSLCTFGDDCPVHGVWSDVQQKLVRELSSTSFADLMAPRGGKRVLTPLAQ